MEEILQNVYDMYGKELPDRDVFSATITSPYTALEIRKVFRTWNNFEYEYSKFLATKRAAVVTEKVITKPAPKVARKIPKKDSYETKKL